MDIFESKQLHLTWADNDLFPYLMGQHNPGVLSDDLASKVAERLVTEGYLEKKPEVTVEMYANYLAEALSAHGTGYLSISVFRELNIEVAKRLSPSANDRSVLELNEKIFDRLAKGINDSNLSPENKKDLLRKIFVESALQDWNSKDFNIRPQWYNNNTAGEDSLKMTKDTVAELIRGSAVTSYANFFTEIVFPGSFHAPGYAEKIKDLIYVILPRDGRSGVYNDHRIETIVSFKTEVLGELKSVLQAKNAAQFEELFQGTIAQGALINWDDEPYAGDRMKSKINSAEWYEMKNAFAKALPELLLSDQRKIEIFKSITATGGTPDTDEVFIKVIHPILLGQSNSIELLKQYLKSKTISSAKLKITLLREALEPRLKELQKQAVGKDGFQALLNSIHELVPHDSSYRDQFIEDILWRLQVEDPELVQMAQSAKSSNWRKANPKAIQWLSTQGALINELTPDQRLELADYIADPRGKEFPKSIEAAFDKKFKESVDRNSESSVKDGNYTRARERYRLAAKMQIYSFATESTPDEKIPAIEMLFTAGEGPLMEQSNFPLRLMRERLGYKENSIKEKVLLAYLKSLPAKETSVTLSFLLSRKGEEGSGLKPIFEVFQTVGIKAGQLGALWKLFGSQASSELKDLKDKASPIQKAEILEIMRTTLSQEEFSEISHIETILGSASVKAVVLVKLKNGKEAVMMVRRPFAEEQIRTNLVRAKAFLAELRKMGVEFDYQAMNSMIDTVEEQLADEIKFTEEAKKIAQAKEIFTALSAEMSAEMGGWKFTVPQLMPQFKVRNNLLFVEKADGMTLNQAPKSRVRELVSRFVVKASFMGLFRRGWFNADGHAGNWLMNEQTMEIFPIDFGQAESFEKSTSFLKADEIYNLAQFLKATLEKNKRAIIEHGAALSAAELTPEKKHSLERAVEAVLARDTSLQDRALALVSAFSESGVKIKKKISFGALKGLVTLEQEKYVSTEEFNQMTRSEVLRVLLKKAPLIIKESAKSFIRSCQDILTRAALN